MLRWRSFWRTFSILYYVVPGGLWWTIVLNLALPPQRHWPDTWSEHQYPVNHMAQKKREGKKGKIEKIKLLK